MVDMNVDDIINYVNNTIRNSEYDILDESLTTVVAESNCAINLLAWARATYPVRSKLVNWEQMIDDTHVEFTQCLGIKQADSLLKGLIRDVSP
jgi:hypothetical protein